MPRLIATATAVAAFINHGSQSGSGGLDDLPQVSGGFGGWIWAMRTANAGNQHLMTKDNGATAGKWDALTSDSPSNGVLRALVFRGTTNADSLSSTVVFPLATMAFGAWDYNGTTIRLFYGTETSAVAECAYNTQTNGVGTTGSDAADSLYVGNLQRNTVFNLAGFVQRGGLFAGGLGGVTGFEAIRVATICTATNNPTTAEMVSGCNAVQTHRLIFDYQGGAITDLTGNGNNGTATLTTSMDFLPRLDLFEGAVAGYLPVTP